MAQPACALSQVAGHRSEGNVFLRNRLKFHLPLSQLAPDIAWIRNGRELIGLFCISRKFLVRSYMPHRHSDQQSDRSGNRSNRSGNRSSRSNPVSVRQGSDRPSQQWAESRHTAQRSSSHPNLTKLIEQDSPLQTHTQLVLMYGPFQTEMLPQANQGVASWIKDCLRKHGLPSLVRFDYRRRAQIFRRDQFQPWLEPLMEG
ncbi:MAG: hypothetical protein HC780_15220 [Leptolyngbyaceae cyanobacterium CSU_1_3]|nr:hypothetical protein [Leptolyngbyaceae cyanobacterium CSU_1_3]